MSKKRVNGWPLLMLVCLPIGLPQAADKTQTAEKMQATDKTKTPSLELLEFLGNWETSDGEWVDPNELLDEKLSAEIETKIQNTQLEESK
jgi:hypothetical protein